MLDEASRLAPAQGRQRVDVGEGVPQHQHVGRGVEAPETVLGVDDPLHGDLLGRERAAALPESQHAHEVAASCHLGLLDLVAGVRDVLQLNLLAQEGGQGAGHRRGRLRSPVGVGGQIHGPAGAALELGEHGSRVEDRARRPRSSSRSSGAREGLARGRASGVTPGARGSGSRAALTGAGTSTSSMPLVLRYSASSRIAGRGSGWRAVSPAAVRTDARGTAGPRGAPRPAGSRASRREPPPPRPSPGEPGSRARPARRAGSPWRGASARPGVRPTRPWRPVPASPRPAGRQPPSARGGSRAGPSVGRCPGAAQGGRRPPRRDLPAGCTAKATVMASAGHRRGLAAGAAGGVVTCRSHQNTA